MTSPGIWPTKEELRGIPDEYEGLAPPVGRHKYDSAEDFSDAIKATFQEEKLLDMVDGPFVKGTRFVQSMMGALEGQTPTSNRIPQRRQQHQR